MHCDVQKPVKDQDVVLLYRILQRLAVCSFGNSKVKFEVVTMDRILKFTITPGAAGAS